MPDQKFIDDFAENDSFHEEDDFNSNNEQLVENKLNTAVSRMQLMHWPVKLFMSSRWGTLQAGSQQMAR